MSNLSNFVSGEPLVFIQMQLRHTQKVHWTEEEKRISLSIYYKAPNLYNFLREKGFKLPCLTLIRKWLNVNNVTPGFTSEIFNKLKIKASTMTIEERECCLIFDEMTIKKALEYNSKLDLVEGFEDLGPLGRNDKIATHAMVFMLRGINQSWKCPVGFILSNNALKANSLTLMIDLCLEQITKTSLNIKVVVCDLGSTNAAALRLLGVSKERPYYIFNDKKIYCVFDYPHLLKCVRNTFIKRDIIVEGQRTSWNDILEFFHLDRKSISDCRAAPKLTERHINPTDFQKMNVKLAAQVFSSSVSRGMKAANHLKLLNNESSLNTANFLGRINDITDCMNSKNLDDKNPMKRPLSTTNHNAVQCLKDAIPFVRSWTTSQGTNPPCFEGLIQTFRGTLQLFEEISSSNQNRFLMTARINQDPIENLFGVIRQRCGHNSNPSAKEFRRNLQHSMSIRLMDPPESSNCEPDGDEPLLINESESAENNAATITDEGFLVNNSEFTISDDYPDNLNFSSHVNPLEDNVICYISGWLAKKCIDKYDCINCSTKLLKPNDTFSLDCESLLFFKSFTRHTGELAHLKKPSTFFHSVVSRQIVVFCNMFPNIISSRHIKMTLVNKIAEETEKHWNQWFNSDCNTHIMYMLDLLVKCKLYYSLKRQSCDLRDKSQMMFAQKRKSREVKLNEKLRKLQHL